MDLLLFVSFREIEAEKNEDRQAYEQDGLLCKERICLCTHVLPTENIVHKPKETIVVFINNDINDQCNCTSIVRCE